MPWPMWKLYTLKNASLNCARVGRKAEVKVDFPCPGFRFGTENKGRLHNIYIY